MEEKKFDTIDEYIMSFNPEIRKILDELRSIIRESAPEAKEKISWNMPTYVYGGNLVHFAANKKHVGFYPGSDCVDVFKDEVIEFKGTKASIHFPFNKPMPRELIKRIVKYRLEENKKQI